MKKINLLLICIVISTSSFAQNKIESTGSVGIGITSPNVPLHVFGTGNLVRFESSDNSTDAESTLLLNVGNTSRAMIQWHKQSSSSFAGGISFGTRGHDGLNQRMYINNDGNVGIGTSDTGTHKLAVGGSIGAREIKVEASGWSDFVFEKDYELRTLEEVERHIMTKGHLPEIPNEIEVSENGINLGKMDAKLLQKIEELTLYLIEQNKRIDKLEAKNARLEKEISTFKNE
ncbi:tail fiber protein [Reichenbachiella agariperforans]|uniref:tail fiber protein n=1 Tax=Reichenbachiella agariperforans TaxID=156994 RepID=UPI001C0837E5|nr:tail fiber protein [Reichenbachiella agariperforans]MBU2912951.1 hypothetical protein [Reichenbachiella agariperforans]